MVRGRKTVLSDENEWMDERLGLVIIGTRGMRETWYEV